MGYVMVIGGCRAKAPGPYKANFADNTWAQIIDACHKNQVPETWVVGNQKTMMIDETDYAIDIIGKGHDDYADGSGKAPLTFQLYDCFEQTVMMNGTETNKGGWTSCDMRSNYMPYFLMQMPTEVQNGIREVNKLTSAGSQSATINTTADKLFLLSEIEVFGRATYSVSGEGTQYDYYKAGNSKVKKINGKAQAWWERSPTDSSEAFCCVDPYGHYYKFPANNEWGVAFAFCF